MLSDKSMQEFLSKVSPATYAEATQPPVFGNRSASTMDAIKAIILREGLHRGDPLPTEAQLCDTLGVSRSSVREALRKLEALDIVTVQQGRGTFVGSMSLQPMVETLVLRNSTDQEQRVKSLEDVVDTRRMLDRAVAAEIVRKIKGTRQDRLWELVDNMKRYAADGEAYWEDDIAFHTEMLSVLDNDLVQRLMNAMWLVHQAVLPQIRTEERQRFSAAADAHRQMLEAALAGDLEAYLEAIDAHYSPLAEIIQANKEEQAAREQELPARAVS